MTTGNTAEDAMRATCDAILRGDMMGVMQELTPEALNQAMMLAAETMALPTPESYVVMLGFPAQPGIAAVLMGATAPPDLEFLAVVPGVFTSYSWNDQTADHFAILGPVPIPVGRHQLSILATDNTGWATDGSDANTSPIVPYTFEVQ